MLLITLFTLILSRYMSVASLTGLTAMGIACTIYFNYVTLILLIWFVVALGVFAHRANIVRLMNGTEKKFLTRKKE